MLTTEDKIKLLVKSYKEWLNNSLKVYGNADTIDNEWNFALWKPSLKVISKYEN